MFHKFYFLQSDIVFGIAVSSAQKLPDFSASLFNIHFHSSLGVKESCSQSV